MYNNVERICKYIKLRGNDDYITVFHNSIT